MEGGRIQTGHGRVRGEPGQDPDPDPDPYPEPEPEPDPKRMGDPIGKGSRAPAGIVLEKAGEMDETTRTRTKTRGRPCDG
jgi:hypothetical protein